MKFNNLSNLIIASLALFFFANVYSAFAAPKLLESFLRGIGSVQTAKLPTGLLGSSGGSGVSRAPSSLDASASAVSFDKLTVSKSLYFGPSDGGNPILSGPGKSLLTITNGFWQGNVIAPQYGGTGLSTYAKGDIIYADADNKLARLGNAIPATGGTGSVPVPVGNVLTMSSGGLPIWGSPGVGPVGPQGPTGLTGPQGPQGPSGSGGGSAPGFYFFSTGDVRINPSVTNGANGSGGTLTVSGDLNLTGASTLTGLTSMIQASSTRLSIFDKLYIGGTATTTINSTGDLYVAGSTTLQNFTAVNSTTTNATSTSFYASNGSIASLIATGATTTTLAIS
ncbi:MAG: hypothetical protein HY974_03945, partial [Candidatus Kerfeldbacteria bacterium]|nr:hypothetical protein [Candidatus Kerfeldbacteria bacterium]